MGNRHRIILILVIIIFLTGCQSYTIVNEDSINYPIINPMPEGYQVAIHLFYPQKHYDILKEEVRIVNLENKKLETVVIEELLKGTQKSEFRNIIPNGVKVLSVYLQDDIAYVNFNKALIKEDLDESEEALIIYSIVNSLTKIENIDKVQILIEGEKREKLNRYKINEPIEFSNLIVEMSYISPIDIVKEYYDALVKRDYRKMLEMESLQAINETKYNLFASYYETKELGLAYCEVDNAEIVKYDDEIILLYELNLYYSDGRAVKSGIMEMNMKYENNKFVITKITNHKQTE